MPDLKEKTVISRLRAGDAQSFVARSFVPVLIVLAILTQLQSTAFAQENKSKVVAVMSISSVDQLLDNVAYLTEVAGQEDTGQLASMLVKAQLEGIDFSKPIGMGLRTDGEEWIPLGFVPVTDLDKVFAAMEESVGAPRDLGNGIKEIPNPANPIFVKERDGWAFVGQTVESMAALPQNPIAMLGQMPNEYDIALRGNIQNVPKEFIDMAVNALQDGVRQGLQNLDDEDRVAQEAMVKTQLEQMETFIKESDKVTIGWKTEREKQRTYLDMTFTAIPGGALAKQMNDMAEAKSDFTGFVIPDAAFTMNMATEIPPEQIKTSIDGIEQLKVTALKEIEKDDDLETAEARSAAKEMVSAAMDIFVATIETGKMDGGMSIVMEPGDISMLAGFHVADGKDVEKILRRAADMAKEEPDFPGIKFNADKAGDVAFHTMTVPVPEEEEARKVLGDTMEMAVGTSDDSVYVGFGKGCIGKLKSIISSQPKQKKVAPFQMTFSLTPIMEFAAEMDDNPMLGSVLESLKEADGKDHLKIYGIPVKNGFTYRLELEEGIIGAIGAGAAIAGSGF